MTTPRDLPKHQATSLRFVILHYHILKNAGSTLENILDQNFGERFGRIDTNDRDGLVANSDLVAFVQAGANLRAVSSHQIRYPVPQVPGILFYDLCFLRDPLDRIRSTYDYFRQKPAPGDPVSDLANAAPFARYLTCMMDRFPEQVSDVQVNLLVRGKVDDPPAPSDLAPAEARMRTTSFPGVVDLFQESVAAGRYRLRNAFPGLDCALQPVNVSAGMSGTLDERLDQMREACGGPLYEELLRRNTLDCELLRFARAEVLRRFAEVSEKLREPRTTRRPWRAGFGHYARHLFDRGFYLEKYPDVAAAKIDPWDHYRKHGALERRKPNALFEPEFYRAGCAEAREAADPLRHFLETGGGCADPHPLFDCAAYELAHPELPARGVNPLEHYVRAVRAPRESPANVLARLNVDDEPLILASRDAPGVVSVWQDELGHTRSDAPPWQRPFVENVRFDQLMAQGAAR